MADASAIREHMEVIGADGVHLGTVDKVHGGHIKLAKKDRGSDGHHHKVDLAHVADVEGNQVRLAMNAALVVDLWQEG